MADQTFTYHRIHTETFKITNLCGRESCCFIEKRSKNSRKRSTQKGMTIVVTSIYWKNGRIKFEIGVAKGKKLYDKRETEMKKTIDKETRQQLKER